MNVRTIACVVAALAVVPSMALAQGGGAKDAKKAEKAAAEMKAMMAAWEKAAAIGDNHKALHKTVGSWTTETKSWMGPGEPQVSAGTSEVRTMMEGRFIAEDFSGTMMGKPFTGMGIEGYDNLKKKFVSVWFDSMGTSVMTGDGTADAKGQRTTVMNYIDAMTNKPAKMRVVSRWDGDNKRVAEFFEKHKGKEMKTMEITYTRKASASR